MDAELLRARLAGPGFDLVRFVAAGDGAPGAEEFRQWLAGGMQADMDWLHRTADRRTDPELVLPGVRTVIVMGVNYLGGPQTGAAAGRGPRWARYALHEEYQETIRKGLEKARRVLEEAGAGPDDSRCYVDTGPVLERGWAERAGIGFRGRNGMLISRQHGNWLLLGVILTRLPLPADPPLRPHHPPGDAGRVGLLCGRCARCGNSCPTGALSAPGVVDTRRCIAYHTIENKGAIPRDLRPAFGEWIFGCDICLEACPWNRWAQAGSGLLMVSRRDIAELGLAGLLRMTPERFAEIFRRTPVKRLTLRRLLRNACVVAGNHDAWAVRGDGVSDNRAELFGLVAGLASGHPDALVREHAVWAAFRLDRAAAASRLARAKAAEADPAVLAEYAACAHEA